MEGYAVSAQCMSLVRDNCLLPTKDVPELGYIRESTDKQYVPDVYYKVSEFQFFVIIMVIKGKKLSSQKTITAEQTPVDHQVNVIVSRN